MKQLLPACAMAVVLGMAAQAQATTDWSGYYTMLVST